MQAIQFIDRETGKVETEVVYGEKYLRWLYEGWGTPFLRLMTRPFFSKYYGRRMQCTCSRKKVAPFVKKYGIDLSRFEKSTPEAYVSFNDFFTRKLAAKNLKTDPEGVLFPADGRHLAFQDASEVNGIFVKGQQFSLKKLLQSDSLAKKYKNGSLLLSRLCPTDYHRFHFPISGIPNHPKLINGPLYSVNPIALRKNISYLLGNKRYLTEIQTEKYGTVLMIEIGATCVGSVVQTFSPNTVIAGQEKGFFQFGGSSTITLFPPKTIQFAQDLTKNTLNLTETFAHQGDSIV